MEAISEPLPTTECRSVKWEGIPQSVTMASLIDLMRHRGFDYGGNVRSINWPFERGSAEGCAIIRFENHDLARQFIQTFRNHRFPDSKNGSQVSWSPERIDALPGEWRRPGGSTVVIRGLPQGFSLGRLQNFLKSFFGQVVSCSRTGRSNRLVVCTFANVGSARAALKASRMARQGNRPSVKLLSSLGSPIWIEPHRDESIDKLGHHHDRDPPGLAKNIESTWNYDDSTGWDDSSNDSSPRSAATRGAGHLDTLLAIPEPSATLIWYYVPDRCTPERLAKTMSNYGIEFGPHSPYRGCDIVNEDATLTAYIHCATWEKADALRATVESFPALLGDGFLQIIDEKKDNSFLDIMDNCWNRDTNKTIVTTNVSNQITRSDFINVMSHFGEVRRVLLRAHIGAGGVFFYGFCHFAHRAAAVLALNAGRTPPDQVPECPHRKILSQLSPRVRVKSLTWLCVNRWYIDGNRKKRQMHAWTFTPVLGYLDQIYRPIGNFYAPQIHHYAEELPNVYMIEEKDDGIWYQRRPRFDEPEEADMAGSGTTVPSTDSSARGSVEGSDATVEQSKTGLPPGIWKEDPGGKGTVEEPMRVLWCGGYRKREDAPKCMAAWPGYVQMTFL
ncbi:hypothetical protein FOL47_009456 [Perkinsus chesapeaki]|uniref:RRM domain-containing protein n=1 Tax=Perkinsus chesapeaki TaxID=330153 RepID=A0A7J6MS15_PERCH|nr:hypothetical protein FOL47_009456 [Perkinsus chesapeaki]